MTDVISDLNRFRGGGQLDFRMDVKSLSELLKGTIDPTVRIELKKNLITLMTTIMISR